MELFLMFKEVTYFILNLFFNACIAIKKSFVWALLFLVTSIAYLFFNINHKQKTAVYSTEMVCSYNILPIRAYGDMIQQLSMLAENGDYIQLQKTLKLPGALASAIISIEGRNKSGVLLQEDHSTENNSFIYITVKAKDRAVYAPLQESLLRWLNSSKFELEWAKTDTVRINNKIALLQNDIAHIDSVVKVYPFFLKSARHTDSASSIGNIVALLSLKDQLEDKMLQLEAYRKSYSFVSLLQGFTPGDRPVAKPGKPYIARVTIAIVLSCLFAIIVSIVKGFMAAKKENVHE